MSFVSYVRRATQQENINFLITNRIPRRYATFFMGWFSRIEIRIVKSLTLKVWGVFSSELNLEEAKKKDFKSLHDCFIRELKPDARHIDYSENVIVSPCDGIVGAHGRIVDTKLYQAKGFPYSLMDLLQDKCLIERYRNGSFVTLRLKSTMYHHFHAPYDGSISEVNYISGDTWNVNPIALKRVEKLFCKNERAVVTIKLAKLNTSITLVPVAAILVASMRFKFLPEVLDLRYKGANKIPCQTFITKGEDLGYFQHGSTIIVFSGDDLRLSKALKDGSHIKMGEALFSLDDELS